MKNVAPCGGESDSRHSWIRLPIGVDDLAGGAYSCVITFYGDYLWKNS